MDTQITHSVLVIDDHPLVARGIADYLQSHCGFTAAVAVSHSDDLWPQLQAEMPALFVVDFWLKCGASLALLNRLREQCPNTPILVISADDDPAVVRKVRSSGAQGFLLKQEQPEVFARAVAALVSGDSYFGDITAVNTNDQPIKQLPISTVELGLTQRQGQVLAMMLKGLPNKRIANQLGLSEQTVKEHVSGILQRLGAQNRIEVITKLRGRQIE